MAGFHAEDFTRQRHPRHRDLLHSLPDPGFGAPARPYVELVLRVAPPRLSLLWFSATIFYHRLRALIEDELQKPRASRIRILLLDCEGLTGVDPTARNTLSKVHRLVVEETGLQLVWGGLTAPLAASFKRSGITVGSRVYSSPDVALKWIEDELLRQTQVCIQLVLRACPKLAALHYRSMLASVFSVSTSSPDRIASARLFPHASRVLLSPGEYVFENGCESALFLLVVGEVELEEHRGRVTEAKTMFPGSFFNYQRCIQLQPANTADEGSASASAIDRQAGSAPVSAKALTAVVLLKITRESFSKMQRTEAPLAMQLLLAVIRQSEFEKPGRMRPLPTKPISASLASLPSTLFSAPATHRVELTEFQLERFGEIFDLIDADGSGEIDVHELSSFMKSVGRDVPTGELLSLINEIGIDEDNDGTLSKEELLSFVRQTLVADLPEPLVVQVNAAHAAAAAASPTGRVDRDAAADVLRALGVTLPHDVSTEELMDVVDANGDGERMRQTLSALPCTPAQRARHLPHHVRPPPPPRTLPTSTTHPAHLHHALCPPPPRTPPHPAPNTISAPHASWPHAHRPTHTPRTHRPTYQPHSPRSPLASSQSAFHTPLCGSLTAYPSLCLLAHTPICVSLPSQGM